MNDPNDKGARNASRPSIYILIALSVFLPILLIGIFVLIYATSCRTTPRENEPQQTITSAVPESTAPEETASGEEAVMANLAVPELIGYPLDDALRILYETYGFTNLSVEFTDDAARYWRTNAVVAIKIPAIESKLLFEAPTPSPVPTPTAEPPTPEPETPTPEPTQTPAPVGDTDTIVAEPTDTPSIDTVSQNENTPTPEPTPEPSPTPTPTPTPEPSREPRLSLLSYPRDTEIRLVVFRNSLGSCKADISFPLSFGEDETALLVEIGFETATFEEIPYRVILHSRVRQSEKKPDVLETATVYWYEPVTRNMYLYVNGIAQSSPQSVSFVK